MQWDRERIERILSESDEVLLPRISAVLELLGADEATKRRVTEDLPSLRQKAGELTEFDLYRARLLLGEEQIENLLRTLEASHG